MKLSVDFSNVSEGGKFNVPVGEYVAKIKTVTQEHGQSGYDYLKWVLVIANGSVKGNEITYNTTLKPEGLFALRDFLIACGINLPKTVVSLDPMKLVGKSIGIVVGEREYNGKTYPQIKSVKTANEVQLPKASAKPVATTTDDLDDDDDVETTVSLDDLDD